MDLHSEELRLELRRARSPLMPGEKEEAGGLPQDKRGQGSREPTERGEDARGPGFENGGFSHRVHSIYQEFLDVVQGNLEGGAPMLRSPGSPRHHLP